MYMYTTVNEYNVACKNAYKLHVKILINYILIFDRGIGIYNFLKFFLIHILLYNIIFQTICAMQSNLKFQKR